MADSDVTITAGTGTKIDTRTVGAGVDEHRQVVCIGDPSTAANVANVDSAGSVNVLLRKDLVRLQQAITFTGNPPTAYVAGDQFGGLVSLTGAARASGGTGVITGVAVQSFSAVLGALDVVFFDSTVTLAADSAAFTLSDADSAKVIAVVPLAGAYTLSTNRIAQIYNISVPYLCNGSTTLFAGIIARSSATFVASDFASNLTVFVERN